MPYVVKYWVFFVVVFFCGFFWFLFEGPKKLKQTNLYLKQKALNNYSAKLLYP